MSDYERQPPQDLAAECSVLGGMLLSKDAIAEVTDMHVKGRDFYLPKHEQIFDAVLDLYGRGEPADAVTVANELSRRGELGKAGGPAYLHELMLETPSAASAGYHAEIVLAKARLREILALSHRYAQMAYATDLTDVDEIVDRAQAEAYALSGRREVAEESSNLDSFERVLGRIENPLNPGVMTGFKDLDGLTRGFQPGQMIVVAGRPSHGKSTLDLDFHRHVSVENGEHSAIFSLEMGHDEITTRMIAAEARVPLHHLDHGSMTDRDWERMPKLAGRISQAPLHVIDDANLTMMQIAARARKLARKYPLKLISVDYVQLLNHGGRRIDSRQQEVTEISRSLKLLAKELQIPVIAVAQLNRGPEHRNDKRPVASDLRESGALEQDADVIILIHREDMYERESPRAGEADLIVPKNRNGPRATITVAAQLHYARFSDFEQARWSPSAASPAVH